MSNHPKALKTRLRGKEANSVTKTLLKRITKTRRTITIMRSITLIMVKKIMMILEMVGWAGRTEGMVRFRSSRSKG